jgi:hypothetical protein
MMSIEELCNIYKFNVIQNDGIYAIPVSDMLQYANTKDAHNLVKKMILKDKSLSMSLFNKVVRSGKSNANKKFIVLLDAVKFISDHENPPKDNFLSEFEEAYKKSDKVCKDIMIANERNVAIIEADRMYHPMMATEAVAPIILRMVKAGSVVASSENRMPIFSDEYPFRATQKLIDFIKQNDIRLIEPTFHELLIIECARDRFEISVLKSLIPFYHISVLSELYSYMSLKRFFLFYKQCRKELLNPPPFGCTEYELELRDTLIRFELDNNFLDYEVPIMTADIHEIDLSYYPNDKRNRILEKLEKEEPVPRAEKTLRIVFLHNKTIPYTQFPQKQKTGYQRTHNYNIDTLFKGEDGYEAAHEYLQANLEKFGLKRPNSSSSQLITSPGHCVYHDGILKHRGYLHTNLRVPIYRMCSELQTLYSHRFPGLDIDVDEDDMTLLQSIDWYMRKDGEHLIIYRKKHDNTEEEMKYFLFSKLISEFPEYKIVIITPRIQSCMCRRELTILRLHTTTNKNGYEKSIPHTIIKQRFEKYNAMSYQTICKLYQNALVVNGAQEILPQFTTTGLFTEVVPGNDWLTHEQMLRYRVPEQHNLLPNNDCNTEKIMTPLQTVDSANGTDDPVQLRIDNSRPITYLTKPIVPLALN